MRRQRRALRRNDAIGSGEAGEGELKDDFAGTARPTQDAFGAFDAGCETADLDEDSGKLRAHGIEGGVIALFRCQYFLALVHEVAARRGNRSTRYRALPIGRYAR